MDLLDKDKLNKEINEQKSDMGHLKTNNSNSNALDPAE